jgi:hypothetical protein
MVTISLPSDQRARFRTCLRRAGRREIGGILMGEQVARQTIFGSSTSQLTRRPERLLISSAALTIMQRLSKVSFEEQDPISGVSTT